MAKQIEFSGKKNNFIAIICVHQYQFNYTGTNLKWLTLQVETCLHLLADKFELVETEQAIILI